jgi:hypothetical protein
MSPDQRERRPERRLWTDQADEIWLCAGRAMVTAFPMLITIEPATRSMPPGPLIFVVAQIRDRTNSSILSSDRPASW